MSQPFGDNLQCTGTDSSPYKFGKLQRDPESGDDHAQHRDYNSTPFRWLTSDPAGVKVVSLTDPQTWNMYAYVGNNPVGRSDPSGLACVAGFTIFGSHFGGKCPCDTPPPPPPSPPKEAPTWTLNPQFKTVQQAGKAAARADQHASQQTKGNPEYGNVVFNNPFVKDLHTYSNPVTQGRQNTVDPFNTTGVGHEKPVDLAKSPNPPGSELEAEAHSHSNERGFSYNDVDRANLLTLPGVHHPQFQGEYVGQPNGSVIKYDPKTDKQTYFPPED